MVAFQSVLVIAALQVPGAWQELNNSATAGGISANAGQSTYLSMVLDGAGHPVIAWTDDTPGNQEVYVLRWDGTAWIQLDGSAAGGGISNTGGASANPQIVLDAAGRPVVAWSEPVNGHNEILLRRWNGNAWVGWDGGADATSVSATAETESTSPSMAIDAAGNPVLSWSENLAGINQVCVRRWNGNAWVSYGTDTISASNGGAWNPVVVLDADGKPTVAWWENSLPPRVYLKRWTGAAWIELDGSATGAGLCITGNLNTLITSQSLSISDAANPVVAWSDNSNGNYEVYLRRWNGSAWVGLEPSSTHTNVSTSTGSSRFCQVAKDASSRIVASYTDNTSGNYEIYIKRWNGGAWEDFGGSSTGGGISANTGSSARHVLKLNSGGLPSVAWSDSTPGTFDIFFKRWSLPPAPPSPAAELAQFRSDGTTPLPVGGAASRDGIAFSASGTDDNGDALRLQVEVQPVGTPFSGVPTATGLPGPGAALSVTVIPPVEGVDCHWQARLIDATDRFSAWTSFGDNPETAADFTVPANHAPVAAAIEQISIWDRGVVSTIRIRATLTDAEADAATLAIEIRRVDEAYTGQATSQSAMVASGTTVELPVQLGDGVYRWRYQLADALGKTTGWISYGGNPEWAGDFAFPPFGSSGADKPCSTSAAASPWILSAMLIVAAFFRRTR